MKCIKNCRAKLIFVTLCIAVFYDVKDSTHYSKSTYLVQKIRFDEKVTFFGELLSQNLDYYGGLNFTDLLFGQKWDF